MKLIFDKNLKLNPLSEDPIEKIRHNRRYSRLDRNIVFYTKHKYDDALITLEKSGFSNLINSYSATLTMAIAPKEIVATIKPLSNGPIQNEIIENFKFFFNDPLITQRLFGLFGEGWEGNSFYACRNFICNAMTWLKNENLTIVFYGDLNIYEHHSVIQFINEMK